jgi:hypothetical protein
VSRNWLRDDRGSGEVVAVILIAPVVVAFVVLVFFLGRQVDSRAAVRTAAEAAAQAGARQRDPASAAAAARSTVTDMLTDPSTCEGGPDIAVDLTDFRPGGSVRVSVTCQINNGDLTALAPPERRYTGLATAVVDTYRAEEPP